MKYIKKMDGTISEKQEFFVNDAELSNDFLNASGDDDEGLDEELDELDEELSFDGDDEEEEFDNFSFRKLGKKFKAKKRKLKAKKRKFLAKLKAVAKVKIKRGASPLAVHKKVNQLIANRVAKVGKRKKWSLGKRKLMTSMATTKAMCGSVRRARPVKRYSNLTGAEYKSWVMENKWLVIGAVSLAFLWKTGQLKKFI